MDKKKAHALLIEWQKRLGLQDWRIDFQWKCRPDEMALDDAVGLTTFTETIKAALIQILDPQYYEPHSKSFVFDFEEVLVHELLHLKMCLLVEENNSLQERIAHQILEDIAKALVDAKRFKEKEKPDEKSKPE